MTSCAEWSGSSAVSVAQGGWRTKRGVLDSCRRGGGSEGASSIPASEGHGRLSGLLTAKNAKRCALRKFPLRLIVPRFLKESIRRVFEANQVVDRYYMTYNDYGHYISRPKVTALTVQIGPKSVITFPSGGRSLPGPRILRNHWLGLVRWGRDSQGGGIHRRRPELEGRRDRGTAISNGAYPIWLPLELGRKRVCAQSRCTDELGTVQPTRAQVAKFFNLPLDKVRVPGADNTVQP